MSGGSKLVGAPQALYVLGELLFELRPPAGASPGAGSAPSSTAATPTVTAARVIVLIRAPRRRAHPYHQQARTAPNAPATSSARMIEWCGPIALWCAADRRASN